MPIHRSIKNVVHNFTNTERKVREATSNDAWGPSSTLMAEIADKTHNVMAFTEIMRMIWRRLNDKSKNWRHVYKALVLLEFIIKTGSDKVATQCREHIHSIETLQDFEYVEEGKDYGHNVRVKARSLSTLLRDDERLSEERTKAMLARDRLMHGDLHTSDPTGGSPHPYSSGHFEQPYCERPSQMYSKSPAHPANTELDTVRPQSVGEEELQLQLAIAISKEEHDRDEKKRRADEMKEQAKIQMALEESRRHDQDAIDQRRPFDTIPSCSSAAVAAVPIPSTSYAPPPPADGGLFSLVDTSLSAAPAHLPDPWSQPLAAGTTFAGTTTTASQPVPSTSKIPIDDPWVTTDHNVAPVCPYPTGLEQFDPLNGAMHACGTNGVNHHYQADSTLPSMAGATASMACSNGNGGSVANGNGESMMDDNRRRTPADFLGEHGKLVDLEKLIETNPASTNPFAFGPRSNGGRVPSNPFMANQPAKPSLNELAPTLALTASGEGANSSLMGAAALGAFGSSHFSHVAAVQSSPWAVGNPMPQRNSVGPNPFH